MQIQEILSSLILLSCFVLVANKRPPSYIKTFRIQSSLIAMAAGLEGIHTLMATGRIDVLVVCALILILKVIVIPNMLRKTLKQVDYKVEKDFLFNIPMLVIMCSALVVFTYFTFYELIGDSGINGGVFIVNSISVVFIGFFFMITRRKAIGQIIGFLVIENGLFVTAMYSTHGMPLVVDLGIFIDLLTAMLVMGVMVFRINEKFESTDTGELKNLRG